MTRLQKLILFLGFLILTVIVAAFPVTANASTKPSAGDGPKTCTIGNASRYEAWVKDEACINDQAVALDPLPDEANQALPESGRADSDDPAYPDTDQYIHLVFSSYRDGNWDIYKSESPWDTEDLSNSQQITNHPATDTHPRLRPGSTDVLFTSNRFGDYDLFLMDWNGANLRILTIEPSYEAQASWSPNGSKIAFVSDRDGDLEIYTMQADGTGVIQLTYDAQDDFMPAWSPDGTQLVWVKAVDQENGKLFVMDADGSNPYALTDSLRYLQHPSWAKDNTYIGMDYDADQDGWNQVAVMRPDGSNLHTINLGNSYFNDYIAGSFTNVEYDKLLFNRIQYQLYQGQLYITFACIGSVNPYNKNNTVNSGVCFSNSSLDFYPDAAQVDLSAPVTHVEPLPEYMRAGTFPVSVTGYDTGLAGLYAMNLFRRLGQYGSWEYVQSETSDYFTSDYQGTPGTVYFRSRGIDMAQNLEPWPLGDGDTYTNIYAWELQGQVKDNREHAIPQANVHTEPVFSDQNRANLYGQFHRYVPAEQVSVTVGSDGYNPLPATQMTDQKDNESSFFLPPQGDLLLNGNFEMGLDSWAMSGNLPPVLESDIFFTGLKSAALGGYDFSANRTILFPAPGNSTLPTTLHDSNGNIDLIWVDSRDTNIRNLYYSQKPVDGDWSAPERVVPNTSNSSWLPDISYDMDENVHLVWLSILYDSYKVLYVHQQTAGGWSQVEDISGPRIIHSPEEHARPQIRIDSHNTVHVVWADQDGIWYINKPLNSSWSVPLNISTMFSPHGIAITPDDTLHILYTWDGLTYKSRSVDGTWSDQQITGQTSGYEIDVKSSTQGTLQVVISQNGEISYLERSTTGVWSRPVQITDGSGGSDFSLDTDGENAYILWESWENLKLYRQIQGETWSDAMDIRTGDFGYGMSLVVQGEKFAAIWTENVFEPDLLFTEWNMPDYVTSTLSQAVTVPAEMHRPTLSFVLRHLGTFTVKINNAVVVPNQDGASPWMHYWMDMTPWLGQTVEITFMLEGDAEAEIVQAYIDDVSLGSWLSPVIDHIDPEQVNDVIPDSITITGDNFIETPSVLLGNIPLTGVVRIDEHTLVCSLPTTLNAGWYDVWVINPGGQAGVKPAGLRIGKPVFMPMILK